MRAATEADIPAMLDMGADFHAASGARFGYDRDAMARVFAAMIEADTATVIVSDTGLIGGVLSPAYCDPAWIMAVEMFWWASGGGMALLKAFEAWATEQGAQEVRMTSLAALPKADAILQHKGYAPVEISYQKVI